MASSPTEFALVELTACWDQGYEALARGDIERVEALLEIAKGHLDRLPTAATDTPAESELRRGAAAARGRLEHGMQAGLAALRDELAQARRGKRALGGYRDATRGIGDRVERDA